MSRASTISRLRSGTTYTVTRRGQGSYDNNGIYTAAGSPSTFSIIASIQPVTGRALEQLPEAYHTDEVRQVFTSTELFAGTPTNAPDELSVDGVTWYVFQVAKWDAHGELHYEAMISRVVS